MYIPAVRRDPAGRSAWHRTSLPGRDNPADLSARTSAVPIPPPPAAGRATPGAVQSADDTAAPVTMAKQTRTEPARRIRPGRRGRPGP